MQTKKVKQRVKTPVKTAKVRAGNFKRWRKERGIKLIMAIVPYKGGQKRAVCFFEGTRYEAIATTNTLALDHCIEKIIHEANLDQV